MKQMFLHIILSFSNICYLCKDEGKMLNEKMAALEMRLDNQERVIFKLIDDLKVGSRYKCHLINVTK